ncbi:MAG: protein-glutamate O-methyltransferase CheR [Proteobacteria bacterium]|nr:protein-glutamate O-methyltransferase CheR [Pseudomonadota bacterium]
MTPQPATEERGEARPLDDAEFAELTGILAERTGLLYPPQKRRDLDAKLAPHFEEMTAPEREGFVARVRSSEDALQGLVNRLTIGESYFFRNRPHFSALAAEIIPQLIEANTASRSLRIWSAGCAAGEEPYSIAILLRERFPELAGWDVRILATDINTGFLGRAKEAVYTKWSFRGVEDRIVERYFRKEGAALRLVPEIARAVEFGRFNLSRLPFAGRIGPAPFDLVICRNVLIYFSFEFANRVVQALSDTIRRGGFLVVGHAEAFPALGELESVYSNATYYYRRPDSVRPHKLAAAPAHTVSIPGIAVREVARRPSVPPPPEADDLPRDLEAAQEHADTGELDRAGEILDRLVDGPGKLDHRVHFLRAVVADQCDQTQAAIESLRQAIFIRKEFVIGHYYMGVICDREGEKKAARRCFRNVMETTSPLAEDWVLEEGGGITSGMLREIASERIRELEIE